MSQSLFLLYGDNHNWFAAYAFWLLKVYGHTDVCLINGGRKKIIDEQHALTTEAPTVTPTVYKVTAANQKLRALRQDVLAHLSASQAALVEAGITPDKDIIAYCRIGEHSSHTWFVLTYLLGQPQVRNYDGSWTEWGSSIGVPVELS